MKLRTRASQPERPPANRTRVGGQDIIPQVFELLEVHAIHSSSAHMMHHYRLEVEPGPHISGQQSASRCKIPKLPRQKLTEKGGANDVP